MAPQEEEGEQKGHYLLALERILDIHHRTKKYIFAAHDGDDGNGGVGGEEASSALLGLLTCTPSASHLFENYWKEWVPGITLGQIYYGEWRLSAEDGIKKQTDAAL